MPETSSEEPRAEQKEDPVHQRLSRLFQFLRDTHEMDHEILETLGIKHPHVPILGALEMLDHLRDIHLGQSDEEA